MTELYKGVLVEASRDPGTWEKADRFALVTRPAANVWHLPPDVFAQVIEAHEHAAQGQREAAEPLASLPEVPPRASSKEYAADDLRGGYRWPVNSGLTAVVIFSPALARSIESEDIAQLQHRRRLKNCSGHSTPLPAPDLVHTHLIRRGQHFCGRRRLPRCGGLLGIT